MDINRGGGGMVFNTMIHSLFLSSHPNSNGRITQSNAPWPPHTHALTHIHCKDGQQLLCLNNKWLQASSEWRHICDTGRGEKKSSTIFLFKWAFSPSCRLLFPLFLLSYIFLSSHVKSSGSAAWPVNPPWWKKIPLHLSLSKKLQNVPLHLSRDKV